jgi:hypothetical protein
MSWWEIKDERAGVTLALVNATHLNRIEARRIGDRISTVLGGIPLAMYHRAARPNPTLASHGAGAARWHIISAREQAAVADLYRVEPGKASKIATEIATVLNVPMVLMSNRGLPKYLADHPIMRERSGSLEHRPTSRLNPKPKGRNPGGRRVVFGGRYELEAGEPYRGPHVGVVEQFIAYGKRGAIYGGLVYGDGRFHWLNLSRGGMGTVPFDLAQVSPRDLWAGGKENPARGNPGKRQNAAALVRELKRIANLYHRGMIGHRDLGVMNGRVWDQAKLLGVEPQVLAVISKWRPKGNPSRSKSARIARALKRGAGGNRKKRRAAAAGRIRRFGYLAGRRSERIARRALANPAYRLAWNLYQPGGYRAATGIGDYYVTTQRNQAGRVVGVTVQLNTYAKNAAGYHWADLGHAKTVSAAKAVAQADWNARVAVSESNPSGGYTHGGARAALARLGPRLSVADRHRLKIARDTLKMSDEGARIMGGMTKDEARQVVMSLTGKWPTEPNRRVRSLKRRTARARRASTRSVSASGRAAANPRTELEKAKATYRKWSELEPGKVTRARAPRRVPKAMAKLGELVSVVYRSDKYDGEAKLYEHKTKRPRPVLAADPEGRHVFIVGGNMKITADGLVN